MALAGGRVGRSLVVGVVGAAVSACGQQPTVRAPTAGLESASRSESVVEAAPFVPAGWERMQDDAGSLGVVLPPDLIRIEGFPGVSAQLATDPPTFAIEVHASARGSCMGDTCGRSWPVHERTGLAPAELRGGCLDELLDQTVKRVECRPQCVLREERHAD